MSDGLADKESIKHDVIGLTTVNAPKRDNEKNNLAIVAWWDTHVLGVHCPFCLHIETQTVTQFSTEDPFLVTQKQIDIRTANCEKSKAYRILYPDEEHPAVEELGWKWSGQNKRYETARIENVYAKNCQTAADEAWLADIPELGFRVYQSIEKGQVEGDMQTTSPGVENVEKKIAGTEVTAMDDTKGDEVVDTSTDEIDLNQDVELDAVSHGEVIVVDTRQIPKTLRFEKDPQGFVGRFFEREELDNSESITEPIVPQLPRRAPCKPSKPITNLPPPNITLRHNNVAVIYTPSSIVPITGAYSKTVGFLEPISPFEPRIFTRSGWTDQDFTPNDISHLQSTLTSIGSDRAGADIPTYKVINNSKYTAKVREWCARLDLPLKGDNMDFHSKEGQVYSSHVEKQLIVFALEEYQEIPRFGPYHPSSPDTVIHRTFHIERDPCTDCRDFAAAVESFAPLRFTFEKMPPLVSREQVEALVRRKLAKKLLTPMAKRSRGALKRGGGDYASSAPLEKGTKYVGTPGVKRARKSRRENAEGDLQNGHGWDDYGSLEIFIDDMVVEATKQVAILDDDENDSVGDIIDDPGEYEIAALIKKRTTFNGAVLYLVRWKDTWLTDEQIEHERAKLGKEVEFFIVEQRMTMGGENKSLVRWDDCWKVASGLPNAKKLIEEFEEGLLEKEEEVDD